LKLANGNISLSATDLSNYLSCKHLTQLNRKHANNEIKRPERKNRFLDRIIDRGLEHEAAYIEHLKADASVSVVEFEYKEAKVKEKTLKAMQEGVNIIAQGALANDCWSGRPDLLIKTNTPSPLLGEWSYEVADTKLTKTTKAGTILQLCVYSEMITEIQNLAPEKMYVVMPDDLDTNPFQTETHRFDDYASYFRMAKTQLQQDANSVINTYPEPVSHCDICQWWPDCDERRRKDDHLTFVAGIQKAQIKAFDQNKITTLTKLATADTATIDKVDGSADAITQVYKQAQIQHKGIVSGKPEFEFLEVTYPEEGNNQLRGFLRLPEPEPKGDLFFDIESARHAPGGGLEYLLGFAHGDTKTSSNNADFSYYWGLDRKGEKLAFEAFIDLAMTRLEQFPNMHIYHFAPYEPVALKRLATRHATREAELDILLRKQCFVDLYAVTRQAIRASVESYSIKCLEQFYGYEREEELSDVRQSMHRLEAMLEIGASSKVHSEDKAVVLKYNRDDCISTIELRNWLETLRSQQIATGVDLPRPTIPAEYQSKGEARSAEVQKVYDDLTNELQDTPEADRTPEQQARWLLANSLDYFRREEKNAWWEYYRLRELEEADLIRERNAITGLVFQEVLPQVGRVRNETHRYKYTPQFVTLDTDAKLSEVSSEDGFPSEFNIGTVTSIDHNECLIDIKKTVDSEDKHPDAVFSNSIVNPEPMPETLLSFGKAVASASPHQLQTAQYDLLSKQPPRFENDISIQSVLNKKLTIENSAFELISQLDNSVLAIQGPPGTGKTYTGSRVIVELAKEGKRIGITAVSHAVIANLLSGVAEADNTQSIAHKGTNAQVTAENCRALGNKQNVLTALDTGTVTGATVWTWAAYELDQKLDYLFIDEAGQMSLAMALTAARAAKNVILLGDPQQLEQPQRAAHPEGSEVAALAHLIGDHQTISETQGLFLDTTYRMHPALCSFTSDQYYEGRLKPYPDLERQIIKGDSKYTGQQLRFIPVEHKNNEGRSEEEVEAIHTLITTLLSKPHEWTDQNNKTHALKAEDILVVAPYNAQVALLKKALPEQVRIGTVDKFQGQQAPVVIYSMTSSSIEDAPRGMSFLFSPNRFNVATSRARCTVFVFGSPELIMADCKTPEQIQWANGLCRFLEMAEPPA